MGKGSVAGGSGLYMGTAALSERDYVHRAIDRADLIVAIGHDAVEKPPFIMGRGGPFGAARTVEAVCLAIGEILQLFTPEQCARYLANSGYGRT